MTVISTSASKEREAKEGLGARHFIVSKDEAQMKAAAGSLDAIINTVSATHDLGERLQGCLRYPSLLCCGPDMIYLNPYITRTHAIDDLG